MKQKIDSVFFDDKHHQYAPTEKKTEQIGIINVFEQPLIKEEAQTEKNDIAETNCIFTNNTSLIDARNKMPTETYLNIMDKAKEEFKYLERHSVGKKFVNDKLI